MANRPIEARAYGVHNTAPPLSKLLAYAGVSQGMALWIQLAVLAYGADQTLPLILLSSSRVRVMNHNWSATKQRLHSQSVAEISRHSVLSGDNAGHRLGLATRTQISVCKSPFPSAGTTVSLSLFCAKMVQQRPLLQSEVETQLQIAGSHTRWELTT